MASLKLLHLAPHGRGLGGVETLLNRHGRADVQAGFDAWQIALFNGVGTAEERFLPMGFDWRDTPRAMRRKMRGVFAAHAGSVVIWHGGWGLPWFAEFDDASRRIVVLHEHRAAFESWLPGIEVLLDGVLAVSPGIVRDARELLPRFPPERIGYLPLPIEVPANLPPKGSPQGEWVLGCAGRLAPTKRWERLRPCLAELRRLGVRYRVEVVGDGPLRARLAFEHRDDPAVTFPGFVDRAEYWRRLAVWDAALFFTDREGGPIALLEAMAVGAFPLYPAISGSLGDDYAPQVDPRCYYRAGDPLAAARQLHSLLSSPQEIATLRARAQAVAAPHRGEGYEIFFSEFVRRIAALPRISAPPARRRNSSTDWLPLGLITRVFPERLWR